MLLLMLLLTYSFLCALTFRSILANETTLLLCQVGCSFGIWNLWIAEIYPVRSIDVSN